MGYLKSVLVASLLCLCLVSVWADAPAQKPAVSFSPAVVDFGLVPSHQQPTQLVTVTFDRRVFSPDNLPTLQPDRLSTNAEVSLFARFDGPDAIRAVYQVAVHAEQGGLIRDTLVLTTDKGISDVQPIPLTSGTAVLPVVGAVIASLTAAPGSLDFGNVTLGKSKSVRLDIGYYSPGMVRRYTDADAAEKCALAEIAAEFPHTATIEHMSVTSSSPLVTTSSPLETGVNASVWLTWVVTFKSRLPLGRDWAELQFKTQDGYYVTVPVTAEVVAPMKPEPHTPKKH